MIIDRLRLIAAHPALAFAGTLLWGLRELIALQGARRTRWTRRAP